MRSFRKLTLSTLVAVYILILVGGIVRSTGSGMGCPDWPKCFGQWVPPTSVSELPADYKEFYSNYRQQKNVRFARYLKAFGMSETADRLLHDPSVLIETDFNPAKTMVEYFNRLVGVIIGFLIFAVAVSSLQFWKLKRKLTWIAVFTFVLVGFQGWIGSIVVSSNLTPWIVTLHMFLALVIVALLVYLLVASSSSDTSQYSPRNFWWLIGCIAVLLVQVLFGTQVRESIDRVASMALREAWIEAIGADFLIHRSFSWVVLLMHLGLVVNLLKTTALKAFGIALILLILGTITTGVGMANFGVPAYLQPVHLLLATVTFGIQFLLLLKLSRKERVEYSS
jgi:heme a synthase